MIPSLLIARIEQYRPRIIHLMRVAMVGGIGFVLQTIIFELLGIQFHILEPNQAVLLGGEVAILSNFFLNEKFNFKERIRGSFLRRITVFHLVVFVSIFIQWVLVTLAQTYARDNDMLIRSAYLCGIALGFLTNYLGYSVVVWKKQ